MVCIYGGLTGTWYSTRFWDIFIKTDPRWSCLGRHRSISRAAVFGVAICCALLLDFSCCVSGVRLFWNRPSSSEIYTDRTCNESSPGSVPLALSDITICGMFFYVRISSGVGLYDQVSFIPLIQPVLGKSHAQNALREESLRRLNLRTETDTFDLRTCV